VDGPPTALAHQLPRVASSTPCPELPLRAVTGQACAGLHGQHCDRCVHQPPRWSTLPSHVATRPPSPPLESEASKVASCHSFPGVLNRVADELSRAALPGEWRLHPQVVQLIWREFGEAQVDLFASPETSHCQLFYSLSEGTLGTDALAHSWPRCLRKYAFPPDPVQSQGGRGAGPASCALLAQPDLVPRTLTPRDSPSLAHSSEEGPSSQRRGTLWHPRPDLWKLHVWSLDGTRKF